MTAADFTSLQGQIQRYLLNKCTANGGSAFVKSRHIAADFDISAKRIGAAMAALEDDPSMPLLMERRGGSSDGTTWYIENANTVDSNS